MRNPFFCNLYAHGVIVKKREEWLFTYRSNKPGDDMKDEVRETLDIRMESHLRGYDSKPLYTSLSERSLLAGPPQGRVDCIALPRASSKGSSREPEESKTRRLLPAHCSLLSIQDGVRAGTNSAEDEMREDIRHALQLACRLMSGSSCWAAPVCSSWARVSKFHPLA